MNHSVTSRQEILRVSRELMAQKGWPAVNIRGVAGACGVSVGSIYNYFASKEELVGAVVESVWQDIFRRPQDPDVFQDAQACVAWLYQCMDQGSRDYPDFFTLHAVSFLPGEKFQGKQRMQKVWGHILEQLCQVLRSDKKIRPDAFDQRLSLEQFADVIFSLMLSALVRRDYNPTGVQEIIRRTLY